MQSTALPIFRIMVECAGFEPADPLQITILQTATVANAAHTPYCGGRCEIRTHGPFLIDDFQGRCNNPLCQSSSVVSVERFELSTPWSQIKCANRTALYRDFFKTTNNHIGLKHFNWAVFHIYKFSFEHNLDISSRNTANYMWYPRPESNRYAIGGRF